MSVAIGDSIQRYPLLRLIVPYACGIALADALFLSVSSLTLVAFSGCLIAILLMLCLYAKRSRMWHVAYGVVVSVMFLLLGVVCYSQSRDSLSYDWSSKELVYEACVMDVPRERARSTLCEMQVNAVCDSTGWSAVRRKVFVYMEPSAATDSLLPGDVVCFSGKVRVPRNFSEDLDFDYARYVTMQGAAGTVFLPHEKWKRVGTENLTLRQRLLRLRHRLQTDYMHEAFDDSVLGVLAALVLGDRRSLSEETRVAYTDAGVAHVLSLSGLHVSVIYGMLAFVLRGLVRKRNMRWLRELLTIGVLWVFALMVGMAASVVRAVFMCTLYIVARWVSRDSSSINILSLAAFVMLLAHPFYLFDIGFQLSFMAMAAILWLEPKLEQLFRRRPLHPCLTYPLGIISMSLAAQLGTFPLSLHHFGTFPTYFLLTNLIVIPYLNIVLLLTVVWWGLVLTGVPLATGFGQLLQHLTLWMNEGLTHIGQWPHAVLHVDGFSALSVLFTYLMILFLGLFVIKKWPRGLILFMAALLGLLLTKLFE